MNSIFILFFLSFSFSFDLKGKITILNKPNLITEDFIDISIKLKSKTKEIIVPKYKNNTFFINNLEDDKYLIIIQGPQGIEKFETFEILNQTIKHSKFNSKQQIFNLQFHQIDFTEEIKSFDWKSLIKNPMIIMSIVSVGLIFFTQFGMNNMDSEESRLMTHPDIILANGERVDPTKLVPSFIPKEKK